MLFIYSSIEKYEIIYATRLLLGYEIHHIVLLKIYYTLYTYLYLRKLFWMLPISLRIASGYRSLLLLLTQKFTTSTRKILTTKRDRDLTYIQPLSLD